MSNFLKLRRLIESSGDVLPAAALEAIIADLNIDRREAALAGYSWITVDEDGWIGLHKSRPAYFREGGCWDSDGVSPFYSEKIPGDIAHTLRLAIRYQDYMREL